MTLTADAERWESLGALLIQRRTALNPRYHNRSAFCEATGLTYRLVYDIEEHRRTNFGGSTLAAIEVAYELEPGAIRRFLDGGSLESAGAAPPPVISRSDSGPYAAIDEIAAVLYAPVVRKRLHDVTKGSGLRPTGEAMFDPDHDPLGMGEYTAAGVADGWDEGMRRGLDLDTAVRFAARAWALMAAYEARTHNRASGRA